MAVTRKTSSLQMALRFCSFYALFLLVLSGGVFAQDPTARPAAAQPTTPAIRSAKPFAPLLWADGITRISDIDAYATTGLNTVVVRLLWRPTANGALTPEDLEPPRAFANAAAAKGLRVIYSLPPAPVGQQRVFRMAGDSEPYFLLWSNWVKNAIEALRDTPNLIGWMLPDDPRALPFAEDVGFSKWLAANYADISVLNAQWNAGFGAMDEVTLAGTSEFIAAWQQKKQAQIPADDTHAQLDELAKNKGARRNSKAAAPKQLEPQTPDAQWPFHPAQLAVAHFKWDAYRLLLGRWAKTVKALDPGHLVFSGRLPDYAQLLSLPPEVDVSVPDMQPQWAEVDIVSHNPQAVDIARRGGRFRAMPVFATGSSAALPAELLPQLVGPWCETALLHGASGFGFSSWLELSANDALRRAVQNSLERLQRAPYDSLWNTPPLATAAVVLTPLADGHTVAEGPPSWAQGPRGLYGFGESMIAGEPTDLVYALRWGTMFGSVDYLSPDDILAEASTEEESLPALRAAAPVRNPLSRYNTVLMPQALSLTPQMSTSLTQYVTQGGVVVADLGLGAAQSSGQSLALPPTLMTLFGVPPALTVSKTAFNLQARSANPLFPLWSREASGARGAPLTGGETADSAAFNSPVAYYGSAWPRDTLLIASAPQLFVNTAIMPLGGRARALESPLTLHPVGMGAAVFAPWQLWNGWRPDHIGFGGFHSDLFVRGASVAMLTAPAFVPAPGPAMGGGAPLSPELVNYPNAVALLNHHPAQAAPGDITTRTSSQVAPSGGASTSPARSTDKSGEQSLQFSAVQTANVANFLWSEAIAVFQPVINGASEETAPLPLATGRPIPFATEAQSGSASPADFSQIPYVTLHAVVKGGESKILRLLPIQVQNAAMSVITATASRYDAKNIQMVVWPNSSVVRPAGDNFNVAITEPGTTRLTILNAPENMSDGYRVLPNSRHRVVITDLAAPVAPPVPATGRSTKPAAPQPQKPAAVTRFHTADAQGKLVIEARGAALVIEVTPIS